MTKIKRFILCDLLDLHKWQRWEIDPNYRTCTRCNLTGVGVWT